MVLGSWFATSEISVAVSVTSTPPNMSLLRKTSITAAVKNASKRGSEPACWWGWVCHTTQQREPKGRGKESYATSNKNEETSTKNMSLLRKSYIAAAVKKYFQGGSEPACLRCRVCYKTQCLERKGRGEA